MGIHMSVKACINLQAGHIPTGRWNDLFFIILEFSFPEKIGVDLVLDPMQRQPESLFFKSWIANPLQVTIIVIAWFWSGNMHFESTLHFSWWPFTLIITLASAQVIIKLSGHQEKCQADQNAYYPPKSRYCYIIKCMMRKVVAWLEHSMLKSNITFLYIIAEALKVGVFGGRGAYIALKLQVIQHCTL